MQKSSQPGMVAEEMERVF